MMNLLTVSPNDSIFKISDLVLVKDFGDGNKAFGNRTETAVAIFADFEGDEVFKITGWTKHPTRSLLEIAESLYK